MKVRISTHTVGQMFGVEGVVATEKGDVIFTSKLRPFGMQDVARADCESFVIKHGHTAIQPSGDGRKMKPGRSIHLGFQPLFKADGSVYEVPAYGPGPGRSVDQVAGDLGGYVPTRSVRAAAVQSGKVIAVVKEGGLTFPVLPL